MEAMQEEASVWYHSTDRWCRAGWSRSTDSQSSLHRYVKHHVYKRGMLRMVAKKTSATRSVKCTSYRKRIKYSICVFYTFSVKFALLNANVTPYLFVVCVGICEIFCWNVENNIAVQTLCLLSQQWWTLWSSWCSHLTSISNNFLSERWCGSETGQSLAGQKADLETDK